jgi:hypothetical protein
MIGDHHGRTAGRATLLVRAADEILDTHRITLRHSGFASPDACSNNAAGWESSLGQLRQSFEQAARPA